MCGENPPLCRSRGISRGSPPRVRGKHDKVRGGAGDVGITPACAGKTRFRMQAASSNRDHPRVCGENLPVCYVLRGCVGSPPRVRGKQRRAGRRDAQRRITPACAGKTLSAFLWLLPLEDHPRVCGENLRRFNPGMSRIGSPPRVRGKRIERIEL